MKTLLTLIVALALLLLSLMSQAATSTSQVPRASLAYKSYVVRTARFEFGMEAPVAALAGQIHQESAWNPRARSAFAAGLTQFTPDTEVWIKSLFPDLGMEGVQDPHWAIRAMVRYDKWLLKKVKSPVYCDQYAKALSGYNGGLGWVYRDEKLAKANGKRPELWWGNTELYSKRKPEFTKENRDYPVKILLRHQPRYFNTGWGETLVCGEKL